MTISEIKAAVSGAGSHFFERSTMRFFDSRVERSVYAAKDGTFYFLTSEQFHGSMGSDRRKRTVRQWNPADPSEVRTVGEFNAWRSVDEARQYAKSLAA